MTIDMVKEFCLFLSLMHLFVCAYVPQICCHSKVIAFRRIEDRIFILLFSIFTACIVGLLNILCCVLEFLVAHQFGAVFFVIVWFLAVCFLISLTFRGMTVDGFLDHVSWDHDLVDFLRGWVFFPFIVILIAVIFSLKPLIFDMFVGLF